MTTEDKSNEMQGEGQFGQGAGPGTDQGDDPGVGPGTGNDGAPQLVAERQGLRAEKIGKRFRKRP
ncbi:MAG: hypothetical protein HN608_20380, partial [Rhodospirillaceae bacterium]|nr:hypothetical protein [Rhodospirillaceae bacterium]